MASSFAFLPMVLAQQAGFQVLARRPEPSALTDQTNNVAQYDQVMCTKLALGYAAGIELLHRSMPDGGAREALDLCCGPGHYTLCLARYLGCESVTGIDLSAPMVEVANKNAREQQLDRVASFRVGDALRLDELPTGRFDLTSFTGAAHHLPDLDSVSSVLKQLDRITRPAGLVMVSDLARLRTAPLTERYVNLLGSDYRDRGLSDFFNDFRNSMYAVWTPAELRAAIPTESRRWWVQIVPRGLPTIQFILGLPVGRKTPFLRRGFSPDEHPLIRDWYPRWKREVSEAWAEATLQEWKLARLTLLTSKKYWIEATR